MIILTKNIRIKGTLLMNKHVVVAFGCWVFEIYVTTLNLVGIHSFEEECSQGKDIVASCN